MMADKAEKKDGVFETVKTIVYALLIAGVFRTLFFQPFWIPSGSMKDTLLIGDFLFVNKMAYGYSQYSCPFSICTFIEDRWLGRAPERGDVVVTVWRRQCEPCRALKAHLDTLLDAFPDGVPVVGVDGEEVPTFRRRYEFDAAPAVLLFADGELVESIQGGIRMDELGDAVDRAY